MHWLVLRPTARTDLLALSPRVRRRVSRVGRSCVSRDDALHSLGVKSTLTNESLSLACVSLVCVASPTTCTRCRGAGNHPPFDYTGGCSIRARDKAGQPFLQRRHISAAHQRPTYLHVRVSSSCGKTLGTHKGGLSYLSVESLRSIWTRWETRVSVFELSIWSQNTSDTVSTYGFPPNLHILSSLWGQATADPPTRIARFGVQRQFR